MLFLAIYHVFQLDYATQVVFANILPLFIYCCYVITRPIVYSFQFATSHLHCLFISIMLYNLNSLIFRVTDL